MNRSRGLNTEQREAIRERLEVLAEEAGGELTPNRVVEDAKDPESPLHRWFDWDDSEAAIKHRLSQARQLIRSIRVEIRTHKTVLSSVAYIRNPKSEGRDQGYVSVKTLRADEEAAREALHAEFARIGALLQRARELAVALGLEGEVADLAKNVARIRSLVSDAPLRRQ